MAPSLVSAGSRPDPRSCAPRAPRPRSGSARRSSARRLEVVRDLLLGGELIRTDVELQSGEAVVPRGPVRDQGVPALRAPALGDPMPLERRDATCRRRSGARSSRGPPGHRRRSAPPPAPLRSASSLRSQSMDQSYPGPPRSCGACGDRSTHVSDLPVACFRSSGSREVRQAHSRRRRGGRRKLNPVGSTGSRASSSKPSTRAKSSRGAISPWRRARLIPMHMCWPLPNE